MQEKPSFAELILFQEAIKHMDASCFSEAIQKTLISERFTILAFKLYLGATNFAAHVQYYPQVMSLY